MSGERMNNLYLAECKESTMYAGKVGDLQSENATLKAEVERLKSENKMLKVETVSVAPGCIVVKSEEVQP